MAKKGRRSAPDIPQVALFIDTSLLSGRGTLMGIARYLREHVAWSVFHEPRDLEGRVPAWLTRWRGDGIIARVQTSQVMDAILETGVPAVDVLGTVVGSPIPLVHVDNAAVAQMAVDHLIERGFREFGYCGIRSINWSAERESKFVHTVELRGYHCSVMLLDPRCHDERAWESQQKQLAHWIKKLSKPVGIMACNDPRGQLVLDACHRANVRVPDEVAVISVDNDLAYCEVSNPPLTSIESNTLGIGFEAARLLDDLMCGKKPPLSPRLLGPVGVVVRESSDTLAINDRDVAEAIAFIRQHACDPISLQDVVRRVSVCRTVLQQRFRNIRRRSISEEIVRARLERACALLRQTDLPLKEIARRCAFGHQEYMGVVFRKILGHTPGQVRAAVGCQQDLESRTH